MEVVVVLQSLAMVVGRADRIRIEDLTRENSPSSKESEVTRVAVRNVLVTRGAGRMHITSHLGSAPCLCILLIRSLFGMQQVT